MKRGPLSLMLGSALIGLVACSSQPTEVPPTPTRAAQVKPPKPTATPEGYLLEVPDMPEGSIAISPEYSAQSTDGRIIINNEFEHQRIDDTHTLDIVVQFNGITFNALLELLAIHPKQTVINVAYDGSESSVQAVTEEEKLTVDINVQALADFNYEIVFAVVHDAYPSWEISRVHMATSAFIHAATGKTYEEYLQQLKAACAQGYSADCDNALDRETYEHYYKKAAGAQPLFMIYPVVQETHTR